ncbi:hypothetical protein [Hydrogenophaga borbori]|uniref:hypothetical protein n=1 Tax=Hydrogenophaga borbori TaxID=2294117 RepID=UPI00301BB39D
MQIRAFTEKRLELEQRIAGFLNSKAGAGRGVVNRDLVKPDIELPKGKPTKTAKAPRDASFAGLTYDEQIAQRVGRLLEESDVTKAKELADTMAKLDELYFSGAIGGKLYDAAMRSLAGSTSAAADKTSKFVQDQERLAELLSSTESAGIEAQRKDMQLLAAPR